MQQMANDNSIIQKEIKLEAYAKINLALDVLGKRADGYHEVKMVMQSIGLSDTIALKKQEINKITLVTNSDKLGETEENIAHKAAKKMFEQYQLPGGLQIELTKRIPIAAGMAGGSTDAAGVLRGINELYDLKLSMEQLCKIGVTLGADVPYCIIGGTVLAEGIGEKLTILKKAPQCVLLIAKPQMSVSTRYVYEQIDAQEVIKHPDIDQMIIGIEEGNLEKISSLTENVLENVTEKKYPVIEQIKQVMLDAGAMSSLMSGSGPTVFGIYCKQEDAMKAKQLIIDNQYADEIFITEFH